MGSGINCCNFFCLFVCNAIVMAPDIGTLVATGRKAIVETIQPVSDPLVQTKNSAVAQTIGSVREILRVKRWLSFLARRLSRPAW